MIKKYSKDVVIYRGWDPVGKFLKCMNREVQNCQEVIKNHFNKPLKMSEEDERKFKKATHCHICQKHTGLMTVLMKNLVNIVVLLIKNAI